MSATDYLEQRILESIYTAQALQFDAVYAALFTSAPGEAGGGTEVSGNGYARPLLAPQSPSGGASSNALTITFPAASASWGTVVAFGIFDALTGGNLLLYVTGLSNSVAVGQVVSIGVGDFDTTVD